MDTREGETPPGARSQQIAGARVAAGPQEEDGQWLMVAKNYPSTRFSGLGQINAGNVKNLRPAWTFSTGSVRGHEAAPLVVGGTSSPPSRTTSTRSCPWVLLTFAPRLWYPIYEERTSRWGLSALEDQQLAGLLMWVPAGVVFILLGLALFAAWIGEAERRVAFTRSEMLVKALAERRAHGGA